MWSTPTVTVETIARSGSAAKTSAVDGAVADQQRRRAPRRRDDLGRRARHRVAHLEAGVAQQSRALGEPAGDGVDVDREHQRGARRRATARCEIPNHPWK